MAEIQILFQSIRSLSNLTCRDLFSGCFSEQLQHTCPQGHQLKLSGYQFSLSEEEATCWNFLTSLDCGSTIETFLKNNSIMSWRIFFCICDVWNFFFLPFHRRIEIWLISRLQLFTVRCQKDIYLLAVCCSEKWLHTCGLGHHLKESHIILAYAIT